MLRTTDLNSKRREFNHPLPTASFPLESWMSPHESSGGKTFASGDCDCRRVGQESYLSEAYRQHT